MGAAQRLVLILTAPFNPGSAMACPACLAAFRRGLPGGIEPEMTPPRMGPCAPAGCIRTLRHRYPRRRTYQPRPGRGGIEHRRTVVPQACPEHRSLAVTGGHSRQAD